MTRIIWPVAAVVTTLWTLTALLAYAVLVWLGDWLAANAGGWLGDPELGSWVSQAVTLAQGLGVALAAVIWAGVTGAILVAAWAVRRLAA
ncbi:MAG: hypothetical protein JNK11_13510 [Alphaproteobacteria bacterium]|nr:hypothetical protein [Alphaproteobacteria bacterium]